MCSSDGAVSWTDIYKYKEESAYDTRHSIYSDIQDIIDQAKIEGISNQFIAGLECAQAKVLGFEVLEKDPHPESLLFDI
jgi:hypothetical protein